jgi:PTH2 family peptidyl-tRNA hydrolase
METKQVIVVRYTYPDGKGGTMSMRKGKLIAQACHASMAFLSHRVFEKEGEGDPYFSTAEELWFANGYAKVCCRVESEDELMEIYHKAKESGLEAHLITDSGKTEFKEPTKTCLAIGPDFVDKINPITGHLKLL